MPDAPIDVVHNHNTGARELAGQILHLLDELEGLNPVDKFAAMQMAMFAVYTAILGWFTPDDSFDNNKAMLMRLHEKLTFSMEAVESDFIAAARSGLDPTDVDVVVH